ncbi:MAG: hypothetical protein HYW48_12735 [Deltaproteobacteria bacterium]|nr:hypothetical protein [Deltaproteobacteria bacterium]
MEETAQLVPPRNSLAERSFGFVKNDIQSSPPRKALDILNGLYDGILRKP